MVGEPATAVLKAARTARIAVVFILRMGVGSSRAIKEDK
jgi:hypothetical protein